MSNPIQLVIRSDQMGSEYGHYIVQTDRSLTHFLHHTPTVRSNQPTRSTQLGHLCIGYVNNQQPQFTKNSIDYSYNSTSDVTSNTETETFPDGIFREMEIVRVFSIKILTAWWRINIVVVRIGRRRARMHSNS